MAEETLKRQIAKLYVGGSNKIGVIVTERIFSIINSELDKVKPLGGEEIDDVLLKTPFLRCYDAIAQASHQNYDRQVRELLGGK